MPAVTADGLAMTSHQSSTWQRVLTGKHCLAAVVSALQQQSDSEEAVVARRGSKMEGALHGRFADAPAPSPPPRQRTTAQAPAALPKTRSGCHVRKRNTDQNQHRRSPPTSDASMPMYIK